MQVDRNATWIGSRWAAEPPPGAGGPRFPSDGGSTAAGVDLGALADRLAPLLEAQERLEERMQESSSDSAAEPPRPLPGRYP